MHESALDEQLLINLVFAGFVHGILHLFIRV